MPEVRCAGCGTDNVITQICNEDLCMDCLRKSAIQEQRVRVTLLVNFGPEGIVEEDLIDDSMETMTMMSVVFGSLLDIDDPLQQQQKQPDSAAETRFCATCGKDVETDPLGHCPICGVDLRIAANVNEEQFCVVRDHCPECGTVYDKYKAVFLGMPYLPVRGIEECPECGWSREPYDNEYISSDPDGAVSDDQQSRS